MTLCSAITVGSHGHGQPGSAHAARTGEGHQAHIWMAKQFLQGDEFLLAAYKWRKKAGEGSIHIQPILAETNRELAAALCVRAP